MNIDSVPESITRADYLRLIESVGLDASMVRALEFRGDGIRVSVKAKHPVHGKSYIDSGIDDEVVATHQLHIPLVD